MGQSDNNRAFDNTHIKEVVDLLGKIKYGSITILVQDGKIIQIDKTEKFRMKD